MPKEAKPGTSQFVKIFAAIVFTVVVWSSAFVGIRAALHDFHPGSLALLRFLVASIAMAIIFVKTPKTKNVSKRDIFWFFILGVTGFAIYNIALNQGEMTVTAGIAGFVISLVPVLVIVWAGVFLGEQLALPQWFGVLVSLAGVVVIAISRKSFEHIDLGVIFMVLAALSASVYVVLQKSMLKKFNAIELTAYAIWSGTLILCIYTPELVLDLEKASLASTLWIIYLGVLPGALGYLSWSYVLSNMDASIAGMSLYSLPILATFMGWIMLGEVPTLMSLVGGFITLSGAIIASRWRRA